MPRRLIQIIVFFSVILLFIMFNLDKKCNISFGFAVIRDVPVFLTVFCSFVLGMRSTLPFIFSYQLGKKRKAEDSKSKPEDPKRKSGDSKRRPAASSGLLQISSHSGID
jgi:uncharacterized integral membrane protein